MKKRIFIKDINIVTLGEAFEKFISYKTAMQKSEYTIKYYTQRYTSFCEFLQNQKGITMVNQNNEDCIIDYINYKKRYNPSISDNTLNNHLRAIRTALYYFMEKSYMEGFHITLITVKHLPKEGFSKNDLQRLVEKPDMKKCDFPEYRNWVIICHLMASGNRTRTMRYIQNKHVDLDEKVIVLAEVKNKEGYEMPISDEYYPILKAYMKVRGGGPEDFLFCTQYGGQLTEGGLRSVMTRYILKHDVDKTSLHRFRNTFAKNWLLEGGSVKKLQHALGHKSAAMVDEYARLYGRELREDFGKYTPLAGFKDTVSENHKIKMDKSKRKSKE